MTGAWRTKTHFFSAFSWVRLFAGATATRQTLSSSKSARGKEERFASHYDKSMVLDFVQYVLLLRCPAK
jgi:hypothetical protein